jgi:hypothetical protein
VEEEAAGEELQYRGVDEDLDESVRGEADPELEDDDGDAPEGEKPGGDALGGKEKKEEDEVEVKLVGEGPALQEEHGEVGGDEQVGRHEIDWVLWSGCGGQRVEAAGDESDGGVDPEDGEDAGEAVVEKDEGVAGAAEFVGCDGGDDDAADDEEEIDAESAMLEGEHEVGGAIFSFDAVEVGENDEHGGQTATDLNAYDSPGFFFRCVGQGWLPSVYCTVRRAVRTFFETGNDGKGEDVKASNVKQATT